MWDRRVSRLAVCCVRWAVSPIPEASPTKEQDQDSIAMMCQEVSQGLSALTGQQSASPAPTAQQTAAMVHQPQPAQQGELPLFQVHPPLHVPYNDPMLSLENFLAILYSSEL